MAQRAEQAATPATRVRELRGATRQPSLERLGERAHRWLTIRGVAGQAPHDGALDAGRDVEAFPRLR